jgi:agmatinase
MLNKIPQTFIAANENYKESKIAIFGAPFDSTSSNRPGSRFGSAAIRTESQAIETFSPYQEKDLENIKFFDACDLELPFGNAEKALQAVEKYAKKIVEDNKIPLMFGGEHLVALGNFRAVHQKFPNVSLIHFDAHADLRDDYLGEKLSHATVIRRIWDILGDGKIFSFGIRSGEMAEFEFAKNHTFMQKFNLGKFHEIAQEMAGPVYVTIDFDVLDPSEFPGTGTPEAGGVKFGELLDAIISFRNLDIVGVDVCELAPNIDTSGISSAIAAKLVREILLAIGE